MRKKFKFGWKKYKFGQESDEFDTKKKLCLIEKCKFYLRKI